MLDIGVDISILPNYLLINHLSMSLSFHLL